MAPGTALPGFGIPLPPLGPSNTKLRDAGGAHQPCVRAGPGSLVPICTQAAALQLGASLQPQHRPGGTGSSWRLLPRAPCSTGAWLTRPLKRQKIPLSAHSSRSVNPQSVQQQPSVVCCLQPRAASAPTHTGRSPGRRRRRVGITFAAPAPHSVPELGDTVCSAMPFAASSGGVPRQWRAGKQGGGLWADSPRSGGH